MAEFTVSDTLWKGEELLNARIKETWFEGRKVYESHTDTPPPHVEEGATRQADVVVTKE